MLDFSEHPGLLYVAATLIPLASFVALLTLGGFKNLGRRYQDKGWGQSLYWLLGGDEPGRAGAYLATSAIGLSCVLAVIGLIKFLGENPVQSHHESHAAHTSNHSGHDHENKPAVGLDHHDEKTGLASESRWQGRMTFAQVGRLRDDHRPAIALELGYRIDHLGAVMFAMVCFIATLIHIFALGYMADETQRVVEDHQAHVSRKGRYERFFMYFSLFCFSMLNLVLADNLFQVFISWELVGACSFFLIGFYFERHSASTAANKAFITNRVGDVGFILGLMILWTTVGSLNFQDIFARIRCPEADTHNKMPLANQIVRAEWKEEKDGESVFRWTPDGSGSQVALFPLKAKHWHGIGPSEKKDDHGLEQEFSVAPKGETNEYGVIPYWLLTLAGFGVFLGCVGKSAQFPLQVWLPDAMEGPTPVSALVHSATMVAAGVYLVGRAFPLFTPEARMIIAYTGAITLFVAASIAVVMNDIKKVLAWSTISQLGFMMLALGVGGWVAGLLHLLTHAFFKALLFLCSGSVIHGCHHEQDMRKMGGLLKKMPITAGTMLVGCLAIAGTPFFSGWYSKDLVLADALAFSATNPGHLILFFLPMVTASITCFYMFRMWFMTFTGKPKDHHVHEHAHESPRVMTVPLVILAAFSLFVAWGWPLTSPEASYLGNILKTGEPASVHTEIGPMHEKAHHLLNYHGIAGLLALVAAIIGASFAITTYLLNKFDPAEAKAQFPRVFALLENKWYFDELYSALFCRPALAIAGWFKNFDITAIDRFIDSLAKWTIGFSRFNGRFDNGVVDGLVNVVGNSVRGMGTQLRHVQTGHLRGYVLFLALGAVGLFALVTYFVSWAAAR